MLRREVEGIRLDATRRLGELLRKQEKAKGARGIGKAPPKCGSGSVPHSQPPTLAEQGISKKLSATAQKLAAIPAEQYEAAKASLDVPSPSKVLDATSPKRPRHRPAHGESWRSGGDRGRRGTAHRRG